MYDMECRVFLEKEATEMSRKNMKRIGLRDTQIRWISVVSMAEPDLKDIKAKKPRSTWICIIICSLQFAEVFFLLVLGSFFMMVSKHFGGIPELLAGILSFSLSVLLVVSVYLLIRKSKSLIYLNLAGLTGVLLLAVITRFSLGTYVLFGLAVVIALSVATFLPQILPRWAL